MGQNAVRLSINYLQVLGEKPDQKVIVIIKKFIHLISEYDHFAFPIMVEGKRAYLNLTSHVFQELLRVEEGVVVVHLSSLTGPFSHQFTKTRAEHRRQWYEA
jgi:pyoverdine/dityrosine biosynthesis protein Dit1